MATLSDPVDADAVMVKMLRPDGGITRVSFNHAQKIARTARRNVAVASGQTRDSIKVVQQRSRGGRFAVGWTVVADVPWSLFLERGRGPGRMPPVDAIRRWTGYKGIDPAAAFPIARKIGRDGTRATYFMSNAVRQTPFSA